jgi:hypothetical protein
MAAIFKPFKNKRKTYRNTLSTEAAAYGASPSCIPKHLKVSAFFTLCKNFLLSKSDKENMRI